MPDDLPRDVDKRPEDPESQAEIWAPIAAATPDRPFVIAQLGQTLDARIATVTGESRYINGSGALDHLHRLRAKVDAVLVGVGTVVADDPELTVRRVEGRHPARVIVDPNGRVPAHARCLCDDSAHRIVVRATDGPAPPGVETIRLPAEHGTIPPARIVAALAARGLYRLLVEGGPTTISRFIDADCVDRLHCLVAPVILGSGRAGLDLAPVSSLAAARRPATKVWLLGDGDVLFDCDLRRTSTGCQA